MRAEDGAFNRSHFDGVSSRQGRDPQGDGDCLVEMIAFDQVVAADRPLGFVKRSISERRFAVFHPHRRRIPMNLILILTSEGISR